MILMCTNFNLIFLMACISVFLLGFSVSAFGSQQNKGDTVTAKLNGLQVLFDSNTGAILKMSHEGPGVFLETTNDRASIIDLAYPLEDFEPLRLRAKDSSGAVIIQKEKSVSITWPQLGLSRPFNIQGDVQATVILEASPDGRSIVFKCKIVNNSQKSVRQVIFPDLLGILPFAGEDKTFFRTCGFASVPFLDLKPNEGKNIDMYFTEAGSYSMHCTSGGMFNNMWTRWYDLGGLKGGFSLFPKRWGWDPQVETRLQLSDVDNKLRIMTIHPVEIKPGESWESGDFLLTPHKYGWAKGIETYREWVAQNYKRDFPVPKHVREGLGYRTVWMCQNQPADPKDAIFKFSDVPELARESKEHGLDEMVLWSWNRSFVLPMPPPYAHIGTEKDFSNAVAKAKEIGVNVVPFVSLVSVDKNTAPRYGLQVTSNQGWTFHTEMIPQWNPPYAYGFACEVVPTNNQQWQEDVYNSVMHLINLGIFSLGWDQYWSTNLEPPNMNTLTTRIRKVAKLKDPESTFCGEELWNLEIDSQYLDYTWNWGGYRDCRPFTSVFPAPRINSTISSCPLTVRMCFADNIYMNIFPRKPGSINGSDYIEKHPQLSQALKQCTKLRKQFLDYFTKGTLIGDCILSEVCPFTHISAYFLPDKALMILINRGDRRSINFDCDLSPWIHSDKGYKVINYNSDGSVISTVEINSSTWRAETPILEPTEMTLYEFTRK